MVQKGESSDLSLESEEKTIPQHAENTEKDISTNVANDNDEPTFDAKATKKLLKKMDLRLVPFLALLYLLSFLDRTNIGNARLFGLEADLGMTGIDYNVALAVFFPPYVLAEIPSNMMMKRYRPSVWLTIIMLAWSFCVIFMGFVNNLTGLMIARIFLGLAEGGLFPGVNYYITMWYRRHECGFRMALFFSAATLAGAFGGLLARGIGSMDGIGGKKGWAWIFIIEGLLTLIVAVFAYWLIADYPATAGFLTPDEKLEVQRRLKLDRNSLADEFNIKFFWDALKDWKIYMQMLIYIGILTPLYSVSLFLPTIIRTMGDGKYTANTAQLMSVPPYIVGCLSTVVAGYYADKLKQRGIFMLGFQVIAIIGWVLLISSSKAANQYVGTFFCVSGIYPLVPMSVAWNGNNIGGSLKRGVGIAMQVGFGNLGGCISAFMYMSKDSPRFYSGHGALIGMISMSFVLTSILTLYLRRENERRDRAYPAPESYTDEMKDAERERGDLASFYRYTI